MVIYRNILNENAIFFSFNRTLNVFAYLDAETKTKFRKHQHLLLLCTKINQIKIIKPPKTKNQVALEIMYTYKFRN